MDVSLLGAFAKPQPQSEVSLKDEGVCENQRGVSRKSDGDVEMETGKSLIPMACYRRDCAQIIQTSYTECPSFSQVHRETWLVDRGDAGGAICEVKLAEPTGSEDSLHVHLQREIGLVHSRKGKNVAPGWDGYVLCASHFIAHRRGINCLAGVEVPEWAARTRLDGRNDPELSPKKTTPPAVAKVPPQEVPFPVFG